MRMFLLIFGWLSVVGSLADFGLAGFSVYLAATDPAVAWGHTVETHLLDHVPILAWFVPLAYFVLPDAFADWIFALPSLVYFPVRGIVSWFLGGWFLRMARQMKN